MKGEARSTTVEKNECNFRVFRGVVQCQAAVHCSAPVTAVRTPCSMAALECTEPVYFINKNLPGVEEKNVTVSEICQAAEEPADLKPWTVLKESEASGDSTQKRRRRE